MQPGEGAAASSKDAQKKAILQQKIKEIFETLVADGLDATTAAVRALQSCLQNTGVVPINRKPASTASSSIQGSKETVPQKGWG
jgi:hypothetical protein